MRANTHEDSSPEIIPLWFLDLEGLIEGVVGVIALGRVEAVWRRRAVLIWGRRLVITVLILILRLVVIALRRRLLVLLLVLLLLIWLLTVGLLRLAVGLAILLLAPLLRWTSFVATVGVAVCLPHGNNVQRPVKLHEIAAKKIPTEKLGEAIAQQA